MILAQKTDRTRSSYWLVRPGSIHESLVQLSLGDTVETCMVAPRPFFLSVPPSKIRLRQKRGAPLREPYFISLVKSLAP